MSDRKISRREAIKGMLFAGMGLMSVSPIIQACG